MMARLIPVAPAGIKWTSRWQRINGSIVDLESTLTSVVDEVLQRLLVVWVFVSRQHCNDV